MDLKERLRQAESTIRNRAGELAIQQDEAQQRLVQKQIEKWHQAKERLEDFGILDLMREISGFLPNSNYTLTPENPDGLNLLDGNAAVVASLVWGREMRAAERGFHPLGTEDTSIDPRTRFSWRSWLEFTASARLDSDSVLVVVRRANSDPIKEGEIRPSSLNEHFFKKPKPTYFLSYEFRRVHIENQARRERFELMLTEGLYKAGIRIPEAA